MFKRWCERGISLLFHLKGRMCHFLLHTDNMMKQEIKQAFTVSHLDHLHVHYITTIVQFVPSYFCKF